MGFFNDLKTVMNTNYHIRAIRVQRGKIEECIESIKAALDDEGSWFLRDEKPCDEFKPNRPGE